MSSLITGNIVKAILGLVLVGMLTVTMVPPLREKALEIAGMSDDYTKVNITRTEYFDEIISEHRSAIDSTEALIYGINKLVLSSDGAELKSKRKIESLDKELMLLEQQISPEALRQVTCGPASEGAKIFLGKDNQDPQKQMVDEVIKCWKKFRSRRGKDTFCSIIDPSRMQDQLTEEDFHTKLDSSGEYGDDIAGASGLWMTVAEQYEWSIDDPLTSSSGTFYICGDRDWIGKLGDEIFIQKTPCEWSAEEHEKLECNVAGFELKQPISEDNSFDVLNPVTWISGYGDPDYVMYYEQFPEGEDESWQMGAFEISYYAITAGAVINVVSFGLMKGAGSVGSKLFSKAGTETAHEAGKQIAKQLVEVTDDRARYFLQQEISASLGKFYNTGLKRLLKGASEAQAGALQKRAADSAAIFLDRVFKEAAKGGTVHVGGKAYKAANLVSGGSLARAGATLFEQQWMPKVFGEAASSAGLSLTDKTITSLAKLGAQGVKEGLKVGFGSIALEQVAKRKAARNLVEQVLSLPGDAAVQAVRATWNSAKSVLESVRPKTLRNLINSGWDRVSLKYSQDGALSLLTTPAKKILWDPVDTVMAQAGIVRGQGIGNLLTSTGLTAGEAALKVATNRRAQFIILAAIAAEYLDSKNEKFISVGMNNIGLRTPYTNTLSSGRHFMGMHPAVEKYYLQLERDEGWLPVGGWLVGDQDPQRLFLASPCKADINIRKAKCRCNPPSNGKFKDFGGGQTEVMPSTVIGDKYDFAVKKCNQLSWYQFEGLGYPETQMDCVTTSLELDQQYLDDEGYNYCFSGGHAMATLMKGGVMITGIIIDSVIIAAAGLSTPLTFGASTVVGLGLLAASGAASAATTAWIDRDWISWPNH